MSGRLIDRPFGHYLEEFENVEPNAEVREQIRDLDARHGRHVGHEFG